MTQAARKYAEVAIRKAWADLLLKLGLRERSAEAYDEALVRAFALTLDFEPAGVTAPLSGNMATGQTLVHHGAPVDAAPFNVQDLQRQFDRQARRNPGGW